MPHFVIKTSLLCITRPTLWYHLPRFVIQNSCPSYNNTCPPLQKLIYSKFVSQNILWLRHLWKTEQPVTSHSQLENVRMCLKQPQTSVSLGWSMIMIDIQWFWIALIFTYNKPFLWKWAEKWDTIKKVVFPEKLYFQETSMLKWHLHGC